jgi:hypothetical protein
MYGRSRAGLLALLTLSTSLTPGQSIAPRRDASVSEPSTEFLDSLQPTLPESNARPEVVALPSLPRTPGSPVHRAPMPRPVPWGGQSHSRLPVLPGFRKKLESYSPAQSRT